MISDRKMCHTIAMVLQYQSDSFADYFVRKFFFAISGNSNPLLNAVRGYSLFPIQVSEVSLRTLAYVRTPYVARYRFRQLQSNELRQGFHQQLPQVVGDSCKQPDRFDRLSDRMRGSADGGWNLSMEEGFRGWRRGCVFRHIQGQPRHRSRTRGGRPLSGRSSV